VDLLACRAKKSHPLQWVVGPLEDEPSYVSKAMFGCMGCYLYGRLVLVLAARGQEPWQGLLIPTDRKHHESLRHEHEHVVIHPVLKKWLYLPETQEDFEDDTCLLIQTILKNDPRIGVEPKTRPSKRRRKPNKVQD
jgi:hypothetical protein